MNWWEWGANHYCRNTESLIDINSISLTDNYIDEQILDQAMLVDDQIDDQQQYQQEQDYQQQYQQEQNYQQQYQQEQNDGLITICRPNYHLD